VLTSLLVRFRPLKRPGAPTRYLAQSRNRLARQTKFLRPASFTYSGGSLQVAVSPCGQMALPPVLRLRNPGRLPARSLGLLATSRPPNLPFPLPESWPLAGGSLGLLATMGAPNRPRSWPGSLRTLTRQAGRILGGQRSCGSRPGSLRTLARQAGRIWRKAELGTRRSGSGNREDLSFSNGTDISMREGRESGEKPYKLNTSGQSPIFWKSSECCQFGDNHFLRDGYFHRHKPTNSGPRSRSPPKEPLTPRLPQRNKSKSAHSLDKGACTEDNSVILGSGLPTRVVFSLVP
jgi:hypothetical protein